MNPGVTPTAHRHHSAQSLGTNGHRKPHPKHPLVDSSLSGSLLLFFKLNDIRFCPIAFFHSSAPQSSHPNLHRRKRSHPSKHHNHHRTLSTLDCSEVKLTETHEKPKLRGVETATNGESHVESTNSNSFNERSSHHFTPASSPLRPLNLEQKKQRSDLFSAPNSAPTFTSNSSIRVDSHSSVRIDSNSSNRVNSNSSLHSASITNSTHPSKPAFNRSPASSSTLPPRHTQSQSPHSSKWKITPSSSSSSRVLHMKDKNGFSLDNSAQAVAVVSEPLEKCARGEKPPLSLTQSTHASKTSSEQMELLMESNNVAVGDSLNFESTSCRLYLGSDGFHLKQKTSHVVSIGNPRKLEVWS